MPEINLAEHSQGNVKDFGPVSCHLRSPMGAEREASDAVSTISEPPVTAQPATLGHSQLSSDTDGIELQQLPNQLDEREETDLGLVILSRCQSPPVGSSSPSQTIYDSAPLGDLPAAIRILEVEQQLDDSEPVIKCGLQVVDLDSNPAFTALSYVWGTASDRKTIWIDGTALSVTKNAWEAPRRLRNKFSPLRIWIDAVCINQDNKDEKDRQLPLMGDIYSRANRVYIWLGEGNEKTERAMRYLEAGALLPLSWIPRSASADSIEDGVSVEEAPLLFRASRMRLRTLWHLSRHRISKYLDCELGEPFSHPWIDRVWTLQEVLMARRPVLVCGESAVPWPAFVCAAVILESFRHVNDIWSPGPSLPPNSESWLELATIWIRQQEHVLAGSPTNLPPVGEEAQRSQPAVAPTADKTMCPAQITKRTRRIQWMISRLPAAACTLFAFLWISWGLPTPRSGPCSILLVIGFVSALLVMVCGFPFRASTSKKWIKAISDPDGGQPVPWRSALMFQIAGRKCSIRTDHYHGVLAILRHQETPTSTNEVVAGESQDTRAYRSLCLDLIGFSGSLDFLAVLSSERPDDAPSWVVQWHEADVLWARRLHETSDSATPGSEPWYRWTPASHAELKVLGVPIGRVTSATPCRIWPLTLRLFGADKSRYPRPTVPTCDPTETNLSGINRGTSVKCTCEPWCKRVSVALVNGMAQADDVVFLLSGLSLLIILREVRLGVDCSFQVIGTAYTCGTGDGQIWTEDVQSRLREITLV